MSNNKKKCTECKKTGEVRLSGPDAKKPNFPYWVCPRCMDGVRPKFLTYGTSEDFPAAVEWKNNSKFATSPSKKRKRETSDEETEEEEAHSKPDVNHYLSTMIEQLKPKLDYIIEMMERNWNPQEEKKEAQQKFEHPLFK